MSNILIRFSVFQLFSIFLFFVDFLFFCLGGRRREIFFSMFFGFWGLVFAFFFCFCIFFAVWVKERGTFFL